jgi:DNA-binding GntR family transcriptional regulator
LFYNPAVAVNRVEVGSGLTTVDAVQDDLERRILGGEFAPGQRLKEVGLATGYGVGRHSVRSAFDALVSRGLLVREPNRGVRVPVPTESDVRGLFAFRELLEVEAFRHAAGTGEVPTAAAAALARLEELAPDAGFEEINDCDVSFHCAVVDRLENRRISRIYRELRAEEAFSRRVRLEQWGRIHDERVREHERLVEALGSGRAAEGERAIRAHLAWSLRQWRAAWERAEDRLAIAPR